MYGCAKINAGGAGVRVLRWGSRVPESEGIAPGAIAPEAVLPRVEATSVHRLHPLHPLHPLSGVVAVFLCGLFAFLDLYATQPILPLLESIFHASKGRVALTISASTLGVALGAPLLGMVTERLSRKRVIVCAVVALTVPTLLAASSPGLGWLIFWRFLQGLITPGVFATTIAYITEQWPPTAVAPVMSIYVSGTALGGFLGRTVVGLLTRPLGWRASFLVLGSLTALGALVIARLLPAERGYAVGVGSRIGGSRIGEVSMRGRLHAHLTPLLRHFRNRRLLATYVVGFNVLFSLVGVFTYITFYLAAPPFSLSPEKLSLLFVVYLIGLVATPLAGAMLPRLGLRRGIASSLTLSLVGVLMTLDHALSMVVTGLALCCTGVFISQACATSFLREAAPPEGRASAVGLYVACYYLGGTVAGVVPSYLWNWGAWPACAVFIALVDVASIAIALRAWRPQEVS